MLACYSFLVARQNARRAATEGGLRVKSGAGVTFHADFLYNAAAKQEGTPT
jgi:hypothetical protein